MIFGQDDSEYQGPRTAEHYRGQGFVILRADNGARADNWISYNLPIVKESGVPWGVYLYLLPQFDVAGQVARMLHTVPDSPPLGYWIDYEQAGLTSSHLQAGFTALDAAGKPSGYYSNDLPELGGFGNRPWWAAAYPGRNDGTYPGPKKFSRPAQLWQFSSTNGTQDVSVVVDEQWFAGVHTPAPPARKHGGSMYFGTIVTDRTHAYAIEGDTLVVEMGGAPGAYGVPKDALDLNASQGIPFFPINQAILDRVTARAKAPVGSASSPVSFKGTFDAVPS